MSIKFDEQSYCTNFCHNKFWAVYLCRTRAFWKPFGHARRVLNFLKRVIIDYCLLASSVHRIERNLFRTESFEFIISAKKVWSFFFLLACLLIWISFFSDLNWLFHLLFLKFKFCFFGFVSNKSDEQSYCTNFCHCKFWAVCLWRTREFKNKFGHARRFLNFLKRMIIDYRLLASLFRGTKI